MSNSPDPDMAKVEQLVREGNSLEQIAKAHPDLAEAVAKKIAAGKPRGSGARVRLDMPNQSGL